MTEDRTNDQSIVSQMEQLIADGLVEPQHQRLINELKDKINSDPDLKAAREAQGEAHYTFMTTHFGMGRLQRREKAKPPLTFEEMAAIHNKSDGESAAADAAVKKAFLEAERRVLGDPLEAGLVAAINKEFSLFPGKVRVTGNPQKAVSAEVGTSSFGKRLEEVRSSTSKGWEGSSNGR